MLPPAPEDSGGNEAPTDVSSDELAGEREYDDTVGRAAELVKTPPSVDVSDAELPGP